MWNYREKDIYSFSEITPDDAEKIDPDFSAFLFAPGSVRDFSDFAFYRFRLRRVSRTGKVRFLESGVAFRYRTDPDPCVIRTDTGEVLREGLFLSNPSGIIVYGPTLCKARKEVGLDEGLTPLFED